MNTNTWEYEVILNTGEEIKDIKPSNNFTELKEWIIEQYPDLRKFKAMKKGFEHIVYKYGYKEGE